MEEEKKPVRAIFIKNESGLGRLLGPRHFFPGRTGHRLASGQRGVPCCARAGRCHKPKCAALGPSRGLLVRVLLQALPCPTCPVCPFPGMEKEEGSSHSRQHLTGSSAGHQLEVH